VGRIINIFKAGGLVSEAGVSSLTCPPYLQFEVEKTMDSLQTKLGKSLTTDTGLAGSMVAGYSRRNPENLRWRR
jgi:hypothetical protein